MLSNTNYVHGNFDLTEINHGQGTAKLLLFSFFQFAVSERIKCDKQV